MKDTTELVGIIADTHENLEMIDRAVHLLNERNVDLVLHAGDFISPITAEAFKELNATLIGVFGNNDGDRLFLRKRFRDEGIGEIERDPHRFDLRGHKVFLMHQPKFLDEFLEMEYSGIYVYGHTHEVDLREGPPLIINPGEVGGWLTGRSTMALLDLGKMEVELVELKEGVS